MKPTTKVILVLGVVLFGVSSFHVVNAHKSDSGDAADSEGSDSDEKTDEKIEKLLKCFKPVDELQDKWMKSVKKNLAAECASNKDVAGKLGMPNLDILKLVGSLIIDLNGLLEKITKLLTHVLENALGITKNFGVNVLKDLNGIVQKLLSDLAKLMGDPLGGVGGLSGPVGKLLGKS